MNLPDLLATHQYQYDGSHLNRNECTLCAMAMLITQAARQEGDAGFVLPAAKLRRWLDRIPFRYPRFPAWFPGPGGATHPLAAFWGVRDYGRKLRRKGHKFAWQPRLRSGQTQADLQAALDANYPTLIYGVGATGIPHVVVPIGHGPEGWLILDPGVPSAKNPVIWSDEQLQKWWRNYGILYHAGTMLSLVPDSSAEIGK